MEVNQELPNAIWEGELKISGCTIRCCVLDDGRRIFNAEDVQSFFNSPQEPTVEEAEAMAKFVKGTTR